MGTSFEFYQKGVEKYNSCDYKGAIMNFDKEIEINPGCAKAFHVRGFAKYMIADKDGAFLDWLKAAELGGRGVHGIIEKYFSSA